MARSKAEALRSPKAERLFGTLPLAGPLTRHRRLCFSAGKMPLEARFFDSHMLLGSSACVAHARSHAAHRVSAASSLMLLSQTAQAGLCGGVPLLTDPL